MSRRLTAADRVPEPGDVIENAKGREYRVCYLLGFAGAWVNNDFIAAPCLSKRWRYTSRADGGPVEVED